MNQSKFIALLWGILLWISLIPGVAVSQSQPMLTPLYFAGVVGGDEEAGRRILLRWDTLDGVVELENAILYRTDGANNRVKLGLVKRTRSPKLIESIFYRSGEERILADAQEFIERVYSNPAATPEIFAQRVIALIDGEDNSEHGEARRNFMVQLNYGFAIMEGLGYVDFVDPLMGPYKYELWQGSPDGMPVDPLAQITLDPTNIKIVPAPVNLREVFLRGRDGVTPALGNNRRIFLNWDTPADYKDFATTAFGFNVYKLARPLAPGESFEDVQDEIVRINEVPILAPSPIEGEQPDQSYIFADDGDWLDTLDEADLLTPGETYTYWAVGRDLLGREGLPSAPLQATVRDTQEPGMPRGLFVVAAQEEDNIPYLKVLWDQMVPDVTAYRIYRYQDYTHAGKKGPFPDFNGLKEGLIAEIQRPATVAEGDKVIFQDYTPNTVDAGTAFWYSISALDSWGNESALSPGAYGVLDDVLGPDAGRLDELCVSRPSLFLSASLADLPEVREPTWRPKFSVTRLSPSISRGRYGRISMNPSGGEVYTELGEFEFFANNEVLIELDEQLVEETSDIPTYRFEVTALDGTTASVDVEAPEGWVPGSTRQIYRVMASIRGFEEFCYPINSGVFQAGLVPVIPGGDVPPFKLAPSCDGEIVSYRLYRSLDGCKTYELVQERLCGEQDFALQDDFHPKGITEACYSIVAIDKHGNLGSPTYLSPTIVYLGEFPNPTMIEANAAGLPGNPTVNFRWIGPNSGILFYRVHFLENGQKQEKPLEFRISDLEYDETLNEYSISTTTINRDGEPISGATNYEVFVEAVTITNAAKESDRLPFSWAGKAFNNGNNGGNETGDYRWNARSLPPVVAANLIAFFSSEHKGVVIEMRVSGGGEAGIEEFRTPDFPFMVWRQRVDKPNQPWVAVSPLIEEYNYTGEFLDDGFFEFIQPEGQFSEKPYFLDNSGHVQNASYRYLLMEFVPKTFEIKRLLGPLVVDTVLPG
ncbi:MAG: hypothetical protein SFY68_06055 [Candidatus Sumerlaeia bacterium]|nr:hypothetical protein [Candidatus Sumerlaeia bacterium]